MNLHVGSFCSPTIRTLMQRVQATQSALQAVPDHAWDIVNEADKEACDDLYAALMLATGLTREELRRLGEYL